MSKSSSKKKKWAVVPLQSDMRKRTQRAFSTVILEAVSSGKSMSLQNLAKVVNENVNATTFGGVECHCGQKLLQCYSL